MYVFVFPPIVSCISPSITIPNCAPWLCGVTSPIGSISKNTVCEFSPCAIHPFTPRNGILALGRSIMHLGYPSAVKYQHHISLRQLKISAFVFEHIVLNHHHQSENVSPSDIVIILISGFSLTFSTNFSTPLSHVCIGTTIFGLISSAASPASVLFIV